jgi:hypothetical protein
MTAELRDLRLYLDALEASPLDGQELMDLAWEHELRPWNMCGCGSGQVPVTRLFYDALRIYHLGGENDCMVDLSKMEALKAKGSGGMWMALYWLDLMGFIEHGSSVPGWIQPEGKRFLKVLSRCFPEQS